MRIISYHGLTTQEGGTQVQKGMNFGIKKNYSIVLMSTAKNSPYADEVFDDGVIEYEGTRKVGNCKSICYRVTTLNGTKRINTGLHYRGVSSEFMTRDFLENLQ